MILVLREENGSSHQSKNQSTNEPHGFASLVFPKLYKVGNKGLYREKPKNSAKKNCLEWD